MENIFAQIFKSDNKINKECYCSKEIYPNEESIMCLKCKNLIHKNCSYCPQNKYTNECPKCFLISLQPLSEVKTVLKTVKTNLEDKQIELNLNLVNVEDNEYVQIRCVKVCNDWDLTSRISWPQFYKIEINGKVYKSYESQPRKTVRLDKQIPFEIFPTQFHSKTRIKIKMAPSRQRFEKTKKYSHLFSIVVVKHLSQLQYKQNIFKDIDDQTVHNCSIRQRFKQNIEQNLPKQQRISLNCPITRTRIDTPVRGQSCYHLQCFDLDNFLQISTTQNNYKCPIFKCFQKCYRLKIDPSLLRIIQEDKQHEIQQIVFNLNGVFPKRQRESSQQITNTKNKINSQVQMQFGMKENYKQINLDRNKMRESTKQINNVLKVEERQNDEQVIKQILRTNYCKKILTNDNYN